MVLSRDNVYNVFCLWLNTSNEETFLQYFLEIQTRLLLNFSKILKKCFQLLPIDIIIRQCSSRLIMVIRRNISSLLYVYMYIYVCVSVSKSHNSVLPVVSVVKSNSNNPINLKPTHLIIQQLSLSLTHTCI